MPQSRISINIHGSNVPDKGRLFAFLRRLNPVAVVVLDSLDLAREIKQLLPACTVIFREYEGDEPLHKQSGAVEWLNRHAHQAAGGLVLHVMNEPSFDEDVLKWLCDLMREAALRRIPLCVGNWAVGNPRPEAWLYARDFLKLLDHHRDLFILGLHEYAGGVITSGWSGGNPTLIKPDMWPTFDHDAQGNLITMYHMGRFHFLLDTCVAFDIDFPRIVLTEHGFDDTSDIKPWLDTLKKTPPFLNIRGWKTLISQWQEWFGLTLNWSVERAYFEQLKWANRIIYHLSPVEAQCIFCWGHSSKDWEQFDIAEAYEFQELLMKEVEQVTIVFPPDAHPGWKAGSAVNPGGFRTNVREAASATSKVLFQIPPEGHSTVFYQPLGAADSVFERDNGGIPWCPIRIILGTDVIRGWVRNDLLTFTEAVADTHLQLVLEFPPEVNEHDLGTLGTALGIVLGAQVSKITIRRA